MKKLIITIALLAGFAVAEDQTFTIAAGSTSVSVTNTTPAQRWYMKSVYALQSGSTNDTLTLKKVSGSTDVVIISDTIATNETNYTLTVPTTVYLSPSEIAKITRANTNYAVTGFIVTKGTD